MQSSLGKLRGSYNCSPGVSTKVADNSLKAMNCSNAFDEPISYKQFDTGTGWGKKQDDRVKREYFERGDLLTEVVVYYATRSALIDMGLDLDEDPKISHDDEMPQAFNSRYCRPPKNWVG